VVKLSEISRGKVIGLAAAGVIFAVGAWTVLQQLGTVTTSVAKNVISQAKPSPAPDSQATTIDNANFKYLVPGTDPAWTFDDKQTAFDQGKGLVKYAVKLNNANLEATITQQEMPLKLKPRGSKDFLAFIDGLKPTRSTDAGKGKLYYLPALKNGAPANGSDTVVYATDDILMFGRSDGVLGYDAWAKLMETMQPVSK
jgi:hypothetical protein